MSKVNPIPEGCNSVSAYLVLKDCNKAIEFYTKAFGAKAGMHMPGPGGSTMHAEVHVGNSTIMMSDENPQWNMKSAETIGDSPVSLHVYVEDADAVFNQAVAAGCEVVSPLMDMFWGDRFGKVKDPFGLQWSLATHVKDMTPEEMAKAQEEFMASMAAGGECPS